MEQETIGDYGERETTEKSEEAIEGVTGGFAKAAQETIRICKDRGILAEFLEENEKELVGIMIRNQLQQAAVESYAESRYADGKKDATLENIRKLMQNLNMSAEKVMQLLEIPASEQAFYSKELKIE